MYIDIDTQDTAEFLCKLAQMETETAETEKALDHIKAIAQNEYNNEYFRTLLKVLKNICNFDYLED